MPQLCTICRHPERAAIEKALTANEPYRHMASRFGTSTGALQRHKPHLGKAIVKAQERREVSLGGSILDQMQDLQARTLRILEKAEASGLNQRVTLAAIREARENAALVAKLVGDLREGPQVNVLVAPEWVGVRQLVIDALESFPEARVAVAGALRRLGNGSG